MRLCCFSDYNLPYSSPRLSINSMYFFITYFIFLIVFSETVISNVLHQDNYGSTSSRHTNSVHPNVKYPLRSEQDELFLNVYGYAMGRKYGRSIRSMNRYRVNEVAIPLDSSGPFIELKKSPSHLNTVAHLISVHSNIPNGYFLDPKGRLRVMNG